MSGRPTVGRVFIRAAQDPLSAQLQALDLQFSGQNGSGRYVVIVKAAAKRVSGAEVANPTGFGNFRHRRAGVFLDLLTVGGG